MIAHNPDRIGKQLWTDSGDGEPIDLYAAYNEMDEARYIVERARQWVRDGGSYTEVAVLYRSNAQSRALEALLSEQVPYRVYGGMRFRACRNQDALAYLRLLSNRNDDAAFERAVNTPTRGIGDRTLDECARGACAGHFVVGSDDAGHRAARWPHVRAMHWPASWGWSTSCRRRPCT